MNNCFFLDSNKKPNKLMGSPRQIGRNYTVFVFLISPTVYYLGGSTHLFTSPKEKSCNDLHKTSKNEKTDYAIML